MPEQFADNDISIYSSALAEGDLWVNSIDGLEQISRLFLFEVVVESRFEGLLDFDQIDAMLAGTAYLAFGDDQSIKYHGVLASVEMLPAAESSRVQYRLSFVPRLWYTTLTRGSWIFQKLSVKDIVKDVLKFNGFTEGEDFEFHLTGKYPIRDYTVQYEETDFAFICRLMEHEGIFFFFEHGHEKEKLVIADSNEGFVAAEGYEHIAFDPRGGAADLQEVIASIARRQRRVPRTMVLKDYNFRTPTVDLRAAHRVDALGRGVQIEYGDHFKDLSEGKRLATIRAQEIFCGKEVYTCQGRVRNLRAGNKFTLTHHFLHAFEQKYVVTSIRHSATQHGTSEGNGGSRGYSNEFEAIPYTVHYRPARITPRPQIAGVTHAKVDGVTDPNGGTPINEHGEYKVSVMYDNAGGPRGKATRYVRMAQPYSGVGYGMHFPLHVGTEVMLTHIDGDPDRPIIAGTVPNAAHTSPVTHTNSNINRIKSRSGMMMGFNDKKG